MRRRRLRAVAWIALGSIHAVTAAVYCGSTVSGTTAARSGFPLDDAWIHMVYGRALAEHGGPYYNPGSLEAGFTSPLWMSVVALAHELGALTNISVVLVVKALGVAFAASASVLLFEMAFALTRRPLASFITGVTLAAHPVVAFSQVSGMEAGVAGALLLATVSAWFARRWSLAGGLLALACLARPEAAVLLPLAAVAAFANAPREGKKTVRDIARAVIPAVVALSSWAVFCWLVTRHPLPNTFYAKHDHRDVLGNLVRSANAIWFDAPTGALGAASVLASVGAVALVRSLRLRSVPLLVAPWLFIAGVAATRHIPHEADRYFYFLRYLVPALPLALLPVASGIASMGSGIEAAGRAVGKLGPAFFRIVGKATTVLFVSACFLPYPTSHVSELERYSWNCRNIDDLQVRIGTLIAARTPSESSVISDDAGAIRYFGGRTTIDLLGLNHHVLLFSKQALFAVQRFPKALDDLAGLYGADYVVLHPAIFTKLVSDPDLSEFFRVVAVVDAENFTVASAAEGRALVLERLIRHTERGPRAAASLFP